jgi:hypothetical protein
MTPQRPTFTFRLDEELRAGLQTVWERDGVPISEQVRRAVQDWLEKKSVKVKTAPRRASTRRKA